MSSCAVEVEQTVDDVVIIARQAGACLVAAAAGSHGQACGQDRVPGRDGLTRLVREAGWEPNTAGCRQRRGGLTATPGRLRQRSGTDSELV